MTNDLLRLLMAVATPDLPVGVGWTSRTIDNQYWQGVAWSPTLHKFAAVGNANVVGVSSDGKTWSTVSCSTSGWTDITWAGGSINRFIACGFNSGLQSNFMTSSDGVTWTTRGVVTGNQNFPGVCYSSTLNRAVAVRSFSGSSAAVNYVSYSNDGGFNWNPANTPADTGGTTHGYLSIAWSPVLSLFVAVGLSSNRFISSPDGITWTTRVTDSSLFDPVQVIWSDYFNMFVCIGSTAESSKTAAYSSDGINWTFGNSWQNFGTLVDTPLKVIACRQGQAGNATVKQTTGGNVWISDGPAFTGNWTDSCYSSLLNRVVVVGPSVCMTSP